MTMIPQCSGCAHLRKPLESGRMPCSAFPEGIPVPVLLNEHDHHKPYPGDHGILFDPIAKEEPEQYAANPCGDAAGGFQPNNTCAASASNAGGASDYKSIAESRGYSYQHRVIAGKPRHILTKGGSQQMFSDEAMKEFASTPMAGEKRLPAQVNGHITPDSVLDAIHELATEKYPHTHLIPVSEIADEVGGDVSKVISQLHKEGKAKVTFGRNNEMLIDSEGMKPRETKKRNVDTNKVSEGVSKAFNSILAKTPTGLVPIPELRDMVHKTLGSESARHDVLDNIIKRMVNSGHFRIIPIDDATGLTAAQLNAGIPGSHETWYFLEKR